MFTIELKENQQWCQFNFHVRAWPIEAENFPFQIRALRRIRRAKTKLLIYTKEMEEMIDNNPENIVHISHIMERGHLVTMNDGGNNEKYTKLLNGK